MGGLTGGPCPLEALQLELQACLLGAASAFDSRVARGPGLEPARRLGIYRHAYRARLLETLRDGFGHTAAYLDDAFDTLAAAYVEENPSRHANLRWYGEDFAAWLAQRCAARPEVAELAALDRALRRAFDGPDAAPLGLEHLALLGEGGWEGVRLRLHPTVARLTFGHNTLALWHALDRDEAMPAVETTPHCVEVLVWRVGHQPHFRSVSAIEACALDALREGLAFGPLCERLAERFAQAGIATEAGALLRRWIDDGVLAT